MFDIPRASRAVQVDLVKRIQRTRSGDTADKAEDFPNRTSDCHFVPPLDGVANGPSSLRADLATAAIFVQHNVYCEIIEPIDPFFINASPADKLQCVSYKPMF